jgi:hypothetical protein
MTVTSRPGSTSWQCARAHGWRWGKLCGTDVKGDVLLSFNALAQDVEQLVLLCTSHKSESEVCVCVCVVISLREASHAPGKQTRTRHGERAAERCWCDERKARFRARRRSDERATGRRERTERERDERVDGCRGAHLVSSGSRGRARHDCPGPSFPTFPAHDQPLVRQRGTSGNLLKKKTNKNIIVIASLIN